MQRRICLSVALLTTLLIPPALNCAAAGDPVELAGDGGWGYAGRHAYIANDTLFFSYLDGAGGKWVASYDFQSGGIARNQVGKGPRDLHGANPLMIRPDGRIQVFIEKGGYHDKRIRWRVSKEPWSVAEFGELQESKIQGEITQGRQFYPMVHRASGAVYLIINAKRDEARDRREAVMWKSPDGGDSWTEYHTLWGLGNGLSGNRCYTRAYLHGDHIHIVTLRVGWSEPLDGHGIGRVEGVYYVRYDVKKEAFFRADGARAFGIADTPLYETEPFDEIWNWEKDGGKRQRALWSDIVADKDGKPYVTFAVLDAVPRGESALHDGYWATPDSTGKWNHYKVATLARGWDNLPERKNYAIALDPQDPHTVFVAKSTSEEKDLSQVHRMRTPDGGRTWQTEAVLSGEGRLSTVVVPRVLDKSERQVDALWLDGRMKGWSDYQTRIMTRR
ncbi:MAG: BNR-4 repeat-containing protein [Thermoguttaceae bacterium]|nr:BNR-4 repeat-containing protein [Thermoguttaceae bacterium]